MANKPAAIYKRRGVKLTQRQAYVFDKLKAGETICVTHLGPDREYSLTSGFQIAADIFNRLQKLEFLKAHDDGLFPGNPQSYSLAPYIER